MDQFSNQFLFYFFVFLVYETYSDLRGELFLCYSLTDIKVI